MPDGMNPFNAASTLLHRVERSRSRGLFPITAAVVPEPITPRGKDAGIALQLVIDESFSTTWSDPDSLRHQDAMLIARHVERFAGPSDSFTVLSFAGKAVAGKVFPASSAVLAVETAPGLPFGPARWGTRLEPVADQVERIQARSGERALLTILITDGECDDAESALTRLAFMGEIFTVGLDRDGKWESVRENWERLGVSTGSASTLHPNSLAAAVMKRFYESAGQEYRYQPVAA